MEDEFETMPRHRPQRMLPHGMFHDLFVDRPSAINAEEERQKIDPDEIKTTLAYTPTSTFQDGDVKALLIGINYTGTEYALSGCVNDIHTMLDTLRKIDFPITESCILVDDETFPSVTAAPTRESIIKHISWLVKDAKPGDVLFFHYSGHGAQTKAISDKDEEYDQCIIPVDYQTTGCILDDDLFKMLVEPLPAGVRLTCVFDCCHSASMLDLPFAFVGSQGVTNDGATAHRMRKVRDGNFSKGDVVMFSGCEDDQTSADVQNTASFGDGETGAGGAATEAFTWALTNTTGLDYLNLLLKTRDVLKDKGFTQVPQLTSSKPLDLDKPFSLFGTVTANEEQLHEHVPEEFRRPPPPPHGPRHARPRGFGHGPMTAFRRGPAYEPPAQQQQQQQQQQPMDGWGPQTAYGGDAVADMGLAAPPVMETADGYEGDVEEGRHRHHHHQHQQQVQSADV
ncbi:Caspase domain containing protein [Novymonas esmeraldas]|uniref:Caspase domain containing protein n=1 Tax=Novymonas esmeraldas TaxID=1808958 RepID=A0AAW0EUX6_9TRYP